MSGWVHSVILTTPSATRRRGHNGVGAVALECISKACMPLYDHEIKNFEMSGKAGGKGGRGKGAKGKSVRPLSPLFLPS